MALPSRHGNTKNRRKLTPEQARLVELHLDVADMAARIFQKRKRLPLTWWVMIEWEDLIQAAREALCIAATTWNPSRGPFPQYAYFRVWFSLIDWLRTYGPETRRGDERVSKYARPWVEDHGDEPDSRMSPTEHILRDKLQGDFADLLAGRQFVSYCLTLLPERERYVVEQALEGRTLASIARSLGVTESRVSQIRTQALGRMRRNDGVMAALTD